MVSQTMTLLTRNGLHARNTAQIVMQAKSFSSQMTLMAQDKRANMKSLFELQNLHLIKNTEITIFADGDDEKKALSKIVQFILNLE